MDAIYVDAGLFAIFIAVLVGPFLWKRIEENLELYLFIMGVLAATVAWKWTYELVRSAIEEPIVRGIVPAVLLAGLIFHYAKDRIHKGMMGLIRKVPLKVMVFFIVVGLGLLSSVITAMIAALLLVELVYVLPLDRKRRVEIVILSCFSIGLGAVLTPMGEPLSTIAIAALKGEPYYAGFFFLLEHLGLYILPGVIAFGLIAAVLVGDERPRYLESLLLIKSHDRERHERLHGSAAKFDQKDHRRPRTVVMRTREGAERAAAEAIAQRASQRGLAVHSVLVPDTLKRHILVETSDAVGLAGLVKEMPDIEGIVEGASRWPEVIRFLRSAIDRDRASEGETVKLVSGPYSGQRALVREVDRDRCLVRLEMENSKICVTVRVPGLGAPGGKDGAAPRKIAEGPPEEDFEPGEGCAIEPEKVRDVFVRVLKVYVFVMALILLGGGMSVLIERYFVRIPAEGLYWVNMVSAVLDNATLTAAEISRRLDIVQIKSALVALLVAGGMLIPGNIPNIIAANKLKIRSSEWARLGVPLGLGAMLAFFIWLYFVPFP